MTDTSQKRALATYRRRLRERGMARFELLAAEGDRALIRSLARRLAEDTPDASRVRELVSETLSGPASPKGGILAALRRSPMVGADLDLDRPYEPGREIDL